MKQHLYPALLFAALAYTGVCAYLFTNQREMLYFPHVADPARESAAATQAEAVFLHNDGETLRIWRIEGNGPDALVYFGGNAERVAYNAPRLAAALGGYTIYLADYRGFGGSTGSPSEAALFSDALVLYDYARDRHRQISVIGRSLGSGVAVYLASRRDVAKLVLVTPYDSIARLAQQFYPALPVSLLLLDKYDSVGRVRHIRAPTLVMVAENDRIVPRTSSAALVAEFPPQQVQVRLIRDSDHDGIHRAPQYLPILKEFL